jgi:hypothetical protein
LLALKIRDLEQELSAIKTRTDAQVEDQMQIQEMLEQYCSGRQKIKIVSLCFSWRSA